MYVPGYKNIEREEESSGSEAIAELKVLYWPEVVVEGLTTIDPEGGEVLEAPSTSSIKPKLGTSNTYNNRWFMTVADISYVCVDVALHFYI